MVELGPLQDMGVGLIVVALAAGIGLALALAFDVLLLQRRPLPPALTGAAVGLAAASGTLTGLVAALSWDPGDPATMRVVAMTTAAARLLALLAAGPVAVTLLLGAVVVGTRGAPRRTLPAAMASVGALATSAVVVAGGYAVGDPVFANLRAVFYAVAGALVAGALLTGREQAAPEAGAAAAISFPLLVACGEGSRRGLVELMMLLHDFSDVDPVARPEVVGAFYDAVAPELLWSRAAVGVACLVGLVGLAGLGRRRPIAALGGMLWLVVAPLILALGDLGPAKLAVVVAG